jgi:hypothetical protein
MVTYDIFHTLCTLNQDGLHSRIDRTHKADNYIDISLILQGQPCDEEEILVIETTQANHPAGAAAAKTNSSIRENIPFSRVKR